MARVTFTDRTALYREARTGDRWAHLPKTPLEGSAPETAADIRRKVAASLEARAGRGDGGHIDHSPGGSPDPYGPSAPAPDRTVHLPDRRTLRPSLKRLDGNMSAADVLSRARAASRMAMRGERYSTEDRLDVAAEIVARVWESVPRNSQSVPDSAATFTRMMGLAANLRRSIDAARERDAADAVSRAAVDGFTPHLPAEAPDVRGTPGGAARVALDMLAALGLPPTGVYRTAAYAVARGVSGEEPRTVARELRATPETVRQHLSRIAGRVPSATPTYREGMSRRDRIALHAEALAVGDQTRPAGTRTPALAQAPRGDGSGAPTYPLRERRAPGRTRRQWDGRTSAQWTRDLDTRTRARLATAARLSRERAQSRTADERTRARLARGITGTVR